MHRIILYLAMAVTCVATAILDVVIARTTGYDPFTFSVWFIVSIGAFGCGVAASSGAIAACYLLHVKPTRADAVAMVAMALACMGLILFLNYWTYTLSNGRPAHEVVDFWKFTDVTIQSSHMRAGRTLRNDLGAMGQYGYLLLGLEVIAFLLGGLASFGIINTLPACQSCPTYLRKVRETSNGEVPVEQADRLIGLMNGDIGEVRSAVSWKAPKAEFKKRDKRAKLTYRLYECPRCKLESVTADAAVFNGKAWKESRTRRSSVAWRAV